MNGATPEDQALKYLIEEDTTFDPTQISTLSSKTSNVVQFRIRQRYALLTLFFQQTVAAPWADTTNWLMGDEYNWFGILFTVMNLGGTVGLQFVVTEIELTGNNMKGSIPADLGLLTALTSFSVGFNSLTGTIPASIGQWTALTYFDASLNQLTGTLPASIGNWSQIQIAYFHANQFTGSMPNGICPYINETIGDVLEADCLSVINCTCCTYCF
jgi:Leucine-rich repeat (LRR) protein